MMLTVVTVFRLGEGESWTIDQRGVHAHSGESLCQWMLPGVSVLVRSAMSSACLAFAGASSR